MNCQECKEACGIVAVCQRDRRGDSAAKLAYKALLELQHRGQESAGVAANGCSGSGLHHYCGLGLISEALSAADVLAMPGPFAIGHTRYSTTGGDRIENAQPIVSTTKFGQVAIGHNGNLVNTINLRRQLISEGAAFRGSTDTEVFLELLVRQTETSLTEALISALVQLEGAYCFVVLAEKAIYAVRDPFGIRPLVLGWRGNFDTLIVASESCVFSRVPVDDWREIEPGEMVRIDTGGIESIKQLAPKPRRPCIFELIYFARPDAIVFGRSVEKTRREFGRQLARQYRESLPDVVIAVPDSAIPAADGFAFESGLPKAMGLMRDTRTRGVRSFMRGTNRERRLTAEDKLIINAPVFHEFTRPGIIDDSVVRGTTMGTLADLCRRHGAKKIGLYVASPKIVGRCFYGIDTADRGDLCAAAHQVHKELEAFLRVDTASYLTIDRLLCAAGYSGDPRNAPFCYACFDPTGDYRGLPVPDEMGSYLESVAKGH